MEQASILICEDEILVARDVKRSLEEFGYQVVGIATCPEDAIKLAEDFKPDLALMDINLNSSVNGIQVAGTLREHFDIPSIFLTAYADSDTVDDAKQTQPLGYLLKPFNDRELFTTIETGISRIREQKNTLMEIKKDFQLICEDGVIEKTVDYVRQIANTEKHAAYRRILTRVARELSSDVFVVIKQLEKLCTSNKLPKRLEEAARTAFIHQEYIAYFLESLERMGEEELLALQTVSIENVILEAMAASSAPMQKDTFFATTFCNKSLFVMADRKAIKKALLHLFSNAKQACTSTPIINLGTSLSYVDSPERFNPKAEAGWYVEVKITDYGTGMDQELIEQAFEPLYTSSDDGFHWGLGLPTVDNIIQRHGGWIKIESTKEMETSVSIFLPEVKKDAVSAVNEVEQENEAQRQIA